MIRTNIFDKIRFFGSIALVLAIVAELVFFPSIHNALGCLMTGICWALFVRFGLRKNVLMKHTFAWLMFLSMSLYRILPLFATLIEGKPITYGFKMPIQTFVGETFLYCLSLGAFLLAVRRRKFHTKLHVLLNKADFYDQVTDSMLWVIGISGLLFQIYVLLSHVEIGDIFGKILSAFTFFQYSPILLLFPSLYKNSNQLTNFKNIYVWVFFVLILFVSFAANSRQSVIEPFGTFMLLLALTYAKHYKQVRHTLSRNIVILGFGALLIFPILSDISHAILSVREARSRVSATTLVRKTLEVYNESRQKIKRTKQSTTFKSREHILDYDEEWTEEYVNNFVLNRYCNLRVTDATLYYETIVGDANPKMKQNFYKSVIMLIPMPLLRAMAIDVDKSHFYSPGDYLYSLATGNNAYLGSMRVTSHLADGIGTFGWLYFPIQFVLFWLCFLALDCLCIITPQGVRYSAFGLITIFTYLAMFRNANGCFGDLSFLLRAFPQFLIVSIIGLKYSSFLVKSFNR